MLSAKRGAFGQLGARTLALGFLFLAGTTQCSGASTLSSEQGAGATGGGGGVAGGTGGTPNAGTGGGTTGGSGGVTAGTGGVGASGGGGGTSGGTAGTGGATAGTGGVAMGGSGGWRNPCDPWPMTQGCLTVEEIEERIAAAGAGGSNAGAAPPFVAGAGGVGTGGSGVGGGASGTAGAGAPGVGGSAGMDGGGGAPDEPQTPNDCPSLPPNSQVFPCVDGIGGPPTHVENGRCCWTCRMVCG